MKIICPHCRTAYQVNMDKRPSKTARARCRKCGNAFMVDSNGNAAPITGDDDRLPEETRVDQLIQDKDQDSAVQVLYEGILRYARGKAFLNAERLRDRLMEIAPMALTEIMDSGEIIETEKIAAMDSKITEPWQNLFSRFSQSEAAAFYFALEEGQVSARQTIFEQGMYNDRLYFVHSGRFVLSYYDTEAKKDVDYSILEKGDIAGVDTFFNLTNHSSTMTAETDGKLLYLDKAAYERVLKENPAVELKLCNFCEERKKTCHIDGKNRLARRLHKRYRVSLKGRAQQIDFEGNSVGEAMGVTLVDISVGGLCYAVRNLKHRAAQNLLQQRVRITATYSKGDVTDTFETIAKVVTVLFHPFEECSVHVQFEKQLEEDRVLQIAGRNAA